MRAAKERQSDIVTQYISEHREDADQSALDVADQDGRTALMFSLMDLLEGSIISKMLLDSGADVNLRDHDNHCALYYAIRNLKSGVDRFCSWINPVYELLLEKNTRIYSPASQEDCQLAAEALFIAVDTYKLGNDNALRIALRKGIDVNLQDNTGTNALGTAIQLTSIPALKLLLEQNNIDIEQPCHQQSSPLSLALRLSYSLLPDDFIKKSLLGCILQLLVKKADINAKNPQGIPLLTEAVNLFAEYLARQDRAPDEHYSILYDREFYPVKKLLECPQLTEVMVTDEPHIWAAVLYKVADVDNIPLMKKLLEAGVSPDYTDFHHVDSILTRAVMTGKLMVVQTLLKQCAKLMIPVDFAWVPQRYDFPALLKAIETNNAAMVAELIRMGASPDITDYKGKSALHYALKKNSKEIVKILLENNACFSVTAEGETVFHSAIQLQTKERPQLIEMLIDSGKKQSGFKNYLNKRFHDKSAMMYELLDMDADIDIVRMLLAAGADPDDLLSAMDLSLKGRNDAKKIGVARCLIDIFGYPGQFISLEILKKYLINLRNACSQVYALNYLSFELAHLTMLEESTTDDLPALLREQLFYAANAGESGQVLHNLALMKIMNNSGKSPGCSFFSRYPDVKQSKAQQPEMVASSPRPGVSFHGEGKN